MSPGGAPSPSCGSTQRETGRLQPGRRSHQTGRRQHPDLRCPVCRTVRSNVRPAFGTVTEPGRTKWPPRALFNSPSSDRVTCFPLLEYKPREGREACLRSLLCLPTPPENCPECGVHPVSMRWVKNVLAEPRQAAAGRISELLGTPGFWHWVSFHGPCGDLSVFLWEAGLQGWWASPRQSAALFPARLCHAWEERLSRAGRSVDGKRAEGL